MPEEVVAYGEKYNLVDHTDNFFGCRLQRIVKSGPLLALKSDTYELIEENERKRKDELLKAGTNIQSASDIDEIIKSLEMKKAQLNQSTIPSC